MYEALWTNGPKECIEFPELSLDEHFGRALPMYLPRALVLDYMLARCKKSDPGIFDDVKFNTSVEHVAYDETTQKFVVRTVDHMNGDAVSEGRYDYCVWAAGVNGRPSTPRAVDDVLNAGGYAGTVMHSSETGPDFDRQVRGKRALVIGDSYSAEDLTLQAIKLGVERVDIVSRRGVGIAYYTGSWPRDCVHIHYAYAPTGVTGDGRGIIMSDGKDEIVLDDVATVIYCTGYEENLDMLHPSLRPAAEGPLFPDVEIPEDWRMPKNPMSKELGHVPIGKILDSPFVQHDMYRGRLISCPNMMFFDERLEVPLMDLDVTAWLLLAQIAGDLPLPPREEMDRFNVDTMLEVLGDPYCRVVHEEKFAERWGQVPDDHWSYDLTQPRCRSMGLRYAELQYRILARDMIDAGYPLRIGTYEKLNAKGRALASFESKCGDARYELDEESDEAEWRTFRDCDPGGCYSVMTGTRAVPLRRRWLELEGDGIDDIVDPEAARDGLRDKVGTGLGGFLRDMLRLR